MKISNRVRSAVCVLLYISYTAIYMARLNLSMSSDALTGAGILTDVEYGTLGGAFLVVYALGRLFNGWLSDRLPPRTMICAGLLLSGAANRAYRHKESSCVSSKVSAVMPGKTSCAAFWQACAA